MTERNLKWKYSCGASPLLKINIFPRTEKAAFAAFSVRGRGIEPPQVAL
jgi:hypothetical protein